MVTPQFIILNITGPFVSSFIYTLKIHKHLNPTLLIPQCSNRTPSNQTTKLSGNCPEQQGRKTNLEMEKPGDCLATHLQNLTVSGEPVLPGEHRHRNLLHSCFTDSSFEPCQVPLRPGKEDSTIRSYTVVFFPLMICGLMF